MSSLADLEESILRTPATPLEAVQVVLDEVFGDDLPASIETITPLVKRDLEYAGPELRERSAKRRRDVDADAIAIVLTDGAPYELYPVIMSGDRVMWGDRAATRLALLDDLLPRVKEQHREEADYILPLAYAAFIVREAFRGVDPSPQRAVKVIYEGGDFLDIPLEEPQARPTR
jgi:hypothetical protein